MPSVSLLRLSTVEQNAVENHLDKKRSEILARYKDFFMDLKAKQNDLNQRVEISGLALKYLLGKLTKAVADSRRTDSPYKLSLMHMSTKVSELLATLKTTKELVRTGTAGKEEAVIKADEKEEAKEAVPLASPSRRVSNGYSPTVNSVSDEFKRLIFTCRLPDGALKANNAIGKTRDIPRNLVMQASHAMMHRGRPVNIRFSLCRIQNSPVILMVCFQAMDEKFLDSEGYNDDIHYFGDFDMTIRFLTKNDSPSLVKNFKVEAWHGTCSFPPVATDAEHLNCTDSTYWDDSFISGDVPNSTGTEREEFEKCILSDVGYNGKGKDLLFFMNTEIKIVSLKSTGCSGSGSGHISPSSTAGSVAVTSLAQEVKFIHSPPGSIPTFDSKNELKKSDNDLLTAIADPPSAEPVVPLVPVLTETELQEASSPPVLVVDKYDDQACLKLTETITVKIGGGITSGELSPNGLEAFQGWAKKRWKENEPAGMRSSDDPVVVYPDIWLEDASLNMELLHFGHKYNIPKLMEDVMENLRKIILVSPGRELTMNLAADILASSYIYKTISFPEDMIHQVARFIRELGPAK